MKETIKKVFPISILLVLSIEYTRDYFRYLRHSGVLAFFLAGESKLLGSIIADYHVVEKGLTMPETRLGFGKDKVLKLVALCEKYIKKYDKTNKQLIQAVAVLEEYEEFHVERNHALDPGLLARIKALKLDVDSLCPSKQVKVSAEAYFNSANASFDQFSRSRRSVRNYTTQEVSREALINAVDLARSAPSSCNRQASRVYIYEDKETIKKILELQGGNRGFGHLANKVLIVTAELGASHGVFERNMAYVDGGIFAMGVLNGLHFNKILACPLNCYFSSWTDKKLRKICGIKNSEIFVVMISCGHAPENFEIAQSYRYPVEEMITFK